MKLITIYSKRLQLLLFWTYNKIPFLLSQFCSKLWKMWLKILAQICPKRGKNNPPKISTKPLSMLLQINNIIMLKWLETLEDFLWDMIFLINPIDLKNLFKGSILNMVFFEHTLGIFNIWYPFFIIIKASHFLQKISTILQTMISLPLIYMSTISR